jgi:FlaA1/EpsC-like NDP-sugar epimerase
MTTPVPPTAMRSPDRAVGVLVRALMAWRRPIIVLLHLVLVVVSSYLALLLRFDAFIPAKDLALWLRVLPVLVIVRGVTFYPFRLYEGLWRYTSISDLRDIVAGVSLSSVAFAVVTRLGMGVTGYPRSVYVIDAVLLVFIMGGLRLGRRVYRELARTGLGKRVLIFGAGDAGEMIVRDMQHNRWYDYRPIGFLDDDRAKVGRRIHGLSVMGTRDDLPSIMVREHPDQVLIAMPRIDPAIVRSVVRALEPFKVPIKTLPNLRDILDGRVTVSQIRNLAIEDLLPRAPVGLDPAPVRELVAGRTVLVTGAGGSIGSELCRQVLSLGPRALVLYERYENSLFSLANELQGRPESAAVFPVVGDVRDWNTLSRVLGRHRPEVIFHAAAHKHVPLMQLNPCEAVKNNVGGAWTLAQVARRQGVERVVLVSTDKAVNPTSVMGATKRVTELIAQAFANGGGPGTTRFTVVRFGNVLGSNGSVVPTFLKQIAAGGPVTVTHPDMRRYFMLIPEAVHLVLHAAAQAEGGEVFVLDMGEQIKVLDVARNLIRLSGFVPDDDIAIEFTGLRPGEKLYEELVGVSEAAEPSRVEKILRVRRGTPPDLAQLKPLVFQLLREATRGDADAVLATLRQVVPTFELPTGLRAGYVPVRPLSSGTTPVVVTASLRNES